jgi:hypothetical protein
MRRKAAKESKAWTKTVDLRIFEDGHNVDSVFLSVQNPNVILCHLSYNPATADQVFLLYLQRIQDASMKAYSLFGTGKDR